MLKSALDSTEPVALVTRQTYSPLSCMIRLIRSKAMKPNLNIDVAREPIINRNYIKLINLVICLFIQIQIN